MNRYGAGVGAGFAATIVLSAMMVLKAMAGIMPEVNVIALLSTMLGEPGMPLIGWIAHFAIGTVALMTGPVKSICQSASVNCS